MTSEEKREEDERIRQARLAKARMLTFVEDEDGERKAIQDERQEQKEKVEREVLKEQIEIIKADTIAAPPKEAIVKIEPSPILEKGTEEKDSMLEGVPKVAEEQVKVVEAQQVEANTPSVKVSAPLDIVPAITPLQTENKGANIPGFEFQDKVFPEDVPMKGQDFNKQEVKKAKQEKKKNEVDSLDAYMEDIAREKYYLIFI